MTFDFNNIADRRSSGCIKYDRLGQDFGRDDLIPMWIADMDFQVHPSITEALSRRFEHPVYGYPLVPDSFWNSITEWLQSRHNLNVECDELTYVPGVVRGIGLAINYYSRPGDGIIIQPPVYHPFSALTEGNGRVVLENPLLTGPDGRYRMDLEGLERLMATEHPSMMILCNPHNPGGRQWDAATLREVASMARRHNVIVISDEIHSDLMLWGTRHIPFLSVSDDARAVGIMFGAPSKTFNIPGLVSSWVVIKNPALRQDFYRWLTVNEFDTPTMMAVEGTVAAYGNGAGWLDQLLRYLEGNILSVEEFVRENLPDIKVMRPEASFLIWLDCRNLGLDHDALIDLFVNRARLALNDGAIFGTQGDGFMRLNIATSRGRIAEALSRLATALASR